MAGEKIYRNRTYYKRDPSDRITDRVSIDPITGCWNWTGKLALNGYGRFELNGKQMYAHRAHWAMHNGEIPEDNMICHHCDNRKCVNLHHLYMGTAQSNMDDAKNRNHMPHGEARRDRKLTAVQVAEMRTLFGSMSDIEIGRKYGVHDATIYNIRKGKRWRRS